MDVNLGQQSGIDVVESIRRNAETADMRVVMTSGFNLKDECLERGADSFLLKPSCQTT
jgi:CheY-like chemotaxis protein